VLDPTQVPRETGFERSNADGAHDVSLLLQWSYPAAAAAGEHAPLGAVEFEQSTHLPIGVAPMSYRAYVDGLLAIIDRVDHAIFTNANTPEVIGLNTREYAACYSFLKLLELPTSRPRKDNGVLSHADVARDVPALAASPFRAILAVLTRASSAMPGRRSLPTTGVAS
jgi:hypothetical protein